MDFLVFHMDVEFDDISCSVCVIREASQTSFSPVGQTPPIQLSPKLPRLCARSKQCPVWRLVFVYQCGKH